MAIYVDGKKLVLWEELDLNDKGVILRRCSSCDKIRPCSYGPDPYAAEILGDNYPCWMCAECDYEHRMDI